MDGAFNSLNLFCIVRAALADTSFLFFYVLAMNPISQIKIMGRATTVNSLFPSSSVPTCVTHLLFDQSLFSFYFYVSLISCPPFLSSLTHKHLCPDATHGPQRLAPRNGVRNGPTMVMMARIVARPLVASDVGWPSMDGNGCKPAGIIHPRSGPVKNKSAC